MLEQTENEYIENELMYLYEKIQNYSKLFPDVASKLRFSLNGSDDPHIQLMLESFAILTSKLQKQIDNSTYPITANILDNLHHSGNKPIPAQNIVKFELDETQINTLVNGIKIPKNTIIYRKVETEFCKFITETDLTFLPFEVKSVSTEKDLTNSKKINLTITFNPLQGKQKQINIDSIKFYLNAPKYSRSHFLDLLFDNNTEIYFKDKKRNIQNKISKNNVSLPYFKEYSESFEYYKNFHDAVKIIRDFFSFKEKFYYIEIIHEEFKKISGEFEIILAYEKNQEKEFSFKKNYILFNTVPIINLYKKTSEPLIFDEKKTQYSVYSNYSLKNFETIFSINSVYYANKESEEILPVSSFLPNEILSSTFYEVKRDLLNPSQLLFNFHQPINKSYNNTPVFCNLYVTNAKYAEKIYENDLFETDYACPVKKIYALKNSSSFIGINTQNNLQWGLLNLYQTNSLPLFDEKYFLQKIRNIIDLYGLNMPENYQETNAFFNSIKKFSINKKMINKSKRMIDGMIDSFEFNFTLDNDNSKLDSFCIFGEFLLFIIKSYLPINNEATIIIKKENKIEQFYRKSTI
ncbi:type VI secretion system baseplate subunit TssF [Pigmentibacter sp. JX0631]|uniref:type VI secretion system baseplate subunit TssF n=1 Tax=Pigmentibacter sp. JX0631 TaxID=2976982 RepID=UPI002468F8BE|nr:type VI secretion system baseplate subunit TssF [Pigmentibacter sp. JX0631]WGL60328.1 type VI secretion system baseplate subunit TssF [Pigmentibacter sp. JX0631]